MSQAQAESAIELLYSNTSVRDELTDDEAEVIIQWGIKHIKDLAAKDLPDEAFEESLGHLTKLMNRINRFAARRADQDPEKQQQSLDRIRESAEQVGLPIAQAQLDAFLSQPVAQADDVNANLQQLLALVDTAASPEGDSSDTPPDAPFSAQPAPDAPPEAPSQAAPSGFINAAAQRAQSQDAASEPVTPSKDAPATPEDTLLAEDDTTRSQKDALSDPTEDNPTQENPARSIFRRLFYRSEPQRDSSNPPATDPDHIERPATHGEETNDE